jgi:ABC-type nickel/cobalt efflux system permease component RcnA
MARNPNLVVMRTKGLMKPLRSSLFVLTALAAAMGAHPMGNFSVSHYARLKPAPGVLRVTYAIDLAEIPTFELSSSSEPEALKKLAPEKMAEWVRALQFTLDGQRLTAKVESVSVLVAEGAGAMPVMRVTAEMEVAVPGGGTVSYEDPNFAGRTGWKEVVTGDAPDRSRALAEYPPETSGAPPQQLRAQVTVPPGASLARTAQRLPDGPWPAAGALPKPPETAEPAPSVAASPSRPVVAAPVAGGPQDASAGTMVRGDYLSTLLSRKELPFDLALLGLGAAFVAGAMHAMSPGHGKTIVAAYLVGARGTLKHAVFLGAMVTFTHTISVFALGLVTLFLSQYILPERIVPWMGAISGLAIVMVGMNLFQKRLAKLTGGGDHHGHDHSHDDGHDHGHTHDHGSGPHQHHDLPEKITLGSLTALGVSGGLVPCPTALVLLLSAIAMGRAAYGLTLLVSFSLGLALVLMAIGGAVLYAKSLMPAMPSITNSRVFQVVPVLSAAVIVGVGVLMTGAALGVFKVPAY